MMNKNKPLFNQVAIIGVGLIGGSMGMAIKKKRLAKKVIGFARRKKTIKEALKLKAIDKGTLNLKQAVKNADLIILATPISTIINLSKQIIKFADKNTVITDVGSSKLQIVSSLEKILPRNIQFVGAHPLAGSEKKGASFGCADLFKNTLCILTPTAKTNKTALKKIKDLWQSLGAGIKIMTPKKHDRILAFVSHLPHMVSFSLINSIPDQYLAFAPAGLKDMTRIASSDPAIWKDIFQTNRKELKDAISKFESSLKKLQRMSLSKKGIGVIKTLATIKNKRDNLT